MTIHFPRRALPLLVLGIAFALRLYQLDFQSIWWDEGHSIFVASHPLADIPTLPAMDVHPPAYFSLLHLWLAVTGRTEFGLRYLSVVWSLLTVSLLWRFARVMAGPTPTLRPQTAPKIPPFGGFGGQPEGLGGQLWQMREHPLTPVAPLALALLAAVSPLYVAYAQEVRSYAMLTFLTLASTFSLWLILFQPHPGRRQAPALALYSFTTAACLYTHYFSFFLLLFHNLAWLVWVLRPAPNKQRAVTWLLGQAGLLLLFSPQLILAGRQITSYTNPNLAAPSPLEFLSRSWQAYTVGLAIEPGLARLGMAVIAAVLLLNLASARRYPPARLLFLIGWLTVPLALYFVVLLRQPSFEPRYMILVTPALLLRLALETDRRLLRLAGRALVLLVLVLSLYSYYTNDTYFKDDSAGVAAWLAAETTPNDIVYVDVPHPFHYYVERKTIQAPLHYLFVDIHTTAGRLSRETAGRDRLYWITWRGSDTDPREVIPFLLQKYGRPLGQRDFRGYHVAWYELPRVETDFRLPAVLTPVEATFGDVLRLDGAAYGGYPPAGLTLPPGRAAWVTLHFCLLRQTGINYRVSLRLRAKTGAVVAQVDRDLLNDRHFRTSAWPLDDPALNQALNVYSLPLPPETPPGLYRLEAVVYNGQPPYPSEGVTGPLAADGAAAVIGQISVLP